MRHFAIARVLLIASLAIACGSSGAGGAVDGGLGGSGGFDASAGTGATGGALGGAAGSGGSGGLGLTGGTGGTAPSLQCPASCTTDGDCALCKLGFAATVCSDGRCAECKSSDACPAGKVCDDGTCIAPCGQAGPTAGSCTASAECLGCGDGTGSPAWTCSGSCTAPATSCSDLGTSFEVLPAPFSSSISACSNEGDCTSTANYPVGSLIKALLGKSSVQVGGTDVPIHDVSLPWPMNRCASVDLQTGLTCGICAPCKVDADCAAVDLDLLAADLFSGEANANQAFGVLTTTLFAPGALHVIHFQCAPAGPGYGICAPCSDPTHACGGI